MPGFNGTGPRGLGGMTGSGRGYCLSYVAPGTVLGQGLGRQAGRGRQHCQSSINLPRRGRLRQKACLQDAVYAPPLSGQPELDFLKEQAVNLEAALEQAKKRIKELENKE